MKIEGRTFSVLNLCHDCGRELNRTHPKPFSEIYDNWTMIVMSSGLCTGKCPGGCQPTFSDLNIKTSLRIIDVATGKPFEFKGYKKLVGRFYTDDYGDVCTCDGRADDEVYESDKYPAIHGPCGRWIARYSDVEIREEKNPATIPPGD